MFMGNDFSTLSVPSVEGNTLRNIIYMHIDDRVIKSERESFKNNFFLCLCILYI